MIKITDVLKEYVASFFLKNMVTSTLRVGRMQEFYFSLSHQTVSGAHPAV